MLSEPYDRNQPPHQQNAAAAGAGQAGWEGGDHALVLSKTDFGEEFYFRTDGGNQVYPELGNKKECYVEDFIEYIGKRINAYL
ncbi:hypothetical protein SC171_20590 [Pantoea cypripedii]